MAAGTRPREAALQILRAVRTGQHFDRALDARLTPLPEVDRKLAHEIAAGVLRERVGLDHRIRAVLARPKRHLPDDVRDVLRIGVYQLCHLDRVPTYAVVQSAVDLAKTACGSQFAPLVNAVLRKTSQRSHEPAFEGEGTAADLAAGFSHPAWLVARWLARFGDERTRRLLRHNNTRPPLVIQPARWTTERLGSALEATGIEHTRCIGGCGLVVRVSRIETLPGYREGGFIVQDSTQRRLLEFITAPPSSGGRVWDACAAPGGKAAILARDGNVLASDRSRRRIARLRENLKRVAPHARIAAADARFPPVLAGTMDLVVVDAPCSATGAIARHPDARWRLSLSRIAAFSRRQKEILAGVAPAVKPAGLLAYLTCSLESEENEEQVDRFLGHHPDFEREGEDLLVFPRDDGADGGFAARLRRAA